MRKTILIAAALVAASAVSAQTGEITSPKGENWLSQDGDYGITIDAYPFLNYVGNLFNGTQNNAPPTWNSLTTWEPYEDILSQQGTGSPYVSHAIIGIKKLVDANTAYRGKVRIGFGSHKETTLVSDMGSTDPNATVENVDKIGGMSIVLGAGIEKRVGSTRVVGVYGSQLLLGFASLKQTYEYGNTLENTGSRVTEVQYGGAMMVGLGVFAGVEWFPAPKLSLSAEYGWGLGLESKGFDTTSWDRNTGDNGPSSVDSGTKTNDFNLDTNLNNVSLGLNFYFQ